MVKQIHPAVADEFKSTYSLEYRTALPSKALLQCKLHELYAQFAPEADATGTR